MGSIEKYNVANRERTNEVGNNKNEKWYDTEYEAELEKRREVRLEILKTEIEEGKR